MCTIHLLTSTMIGPCYPPLSLPPPVSSAALSEYGTHRAVKVGFWPWLSGEVVETFQIVCGVLNHPPGLPFLEIAPQETISLLGSVLTYRAEFRGQSR